MAKDYFQDIVPPSNDGQRRVPPPQGTAVPAPTPAYTRPQPIPSEEERDEDLDQGVIPDPSERSIRNIPITPRAPRRTFQDRDGREVPPVGQGMPRRREGTRWWLWGTAGISVIALGLLLFVALRPTVVTAKPHTRTLTFDQSSQFTAYPVSAGTTDSLTYTIKETDLTDSEVVPSQGTVHSELKASGSLTIYNDYQTTPLRLIATTRFATSDGLIFRVPVDVVVPAKVGATPGKVTVTVQADQPGEKYNVPAGKFTVPGLKSSPTQYEKVYAVSSAPMSGGFVGEKPGVDQAALQAAVSAIRGRLEAKAHETAVSTSDQLVFPELMQISYSDLPDATDTAGVRISESAHISIPTFSPDAFAQAIALASTIDTTGASVRILPGTGFGAQNISTSSVVGTDPLQFSLTGSALLVWDIDTAALQSVLAGKQKAAFQTIVAGISSIQEATARVEPFWKSTFPTDPKSIKVEIVEPTAK